ncbi:MAG TPA: T9SS type A sorting domain-containing protein [Bacteroidia bacterium]|nr:T9SS type A sorting domain-containing protein [Bacteroidia bacterium]
MKSKLLTLSLALFTFFTVNMFAQSPATLGAAIINDGFESWTGTTPNNWMKAPVTTIAPTGVKQAVATGSLTASQSGSFACNLQNTATSYTSGIMGGTPVAVTAGMGYQVSYYARGKGTITCEVTDGSAATTSANYAAANGQSVSGKTWHHFYQTVIAPTTTNNAQFALKVKSTATYTAAGGISITGIDVDSFVVQPYTPVANASLYAIEYTTAANTNSPFYAQYIAKTGGIVTGVTPSSTGGYSAYYIQASHSNIWAGALVFDQTNAPNVAIGDSVTFGCAVDEYFSMTELVQVNNFVKVSSGNPVPAPVVLTTQTMAQEQYEGLLVSISGAGVSTCATYSMNYGQATATDGSGVPGTFDLKNGFYPPHGTATSGTSGLPGYQVTVGSKYCFTGNINYEFSVYNLVPRDSADIIANATTCSVGIETYKNGVNAIVYPNPMNNALIVQLPFEANKIQVSFVDVLGKESAKYSGSGSQVNISDVNLPAGVYMAKIVADGKTQMIKIIKE